MKQQTNFYQDSFKPTTDMLSLDNMILVWLIGFILSVVLYVFEYQKLEISQNSKALATKQQQHQQSLLASLQDSFSKRGDVTVLDRIFSDKNQRHEKLSAVLQQLGLRTKGMGQGVAGIMGGLTEINIKGLWLTEISVYQGQLSLMGQTKEPKQVPLLIEQLQTMSSLSDRRFARLQMLTDDQLSVHNFSLQSLDYVSSTEHKRGDR